MKKTIIAILFFIPLCIFSQGINVIPEPQQVVMKEGYMDVQRNLDSIYEAFFKFPHKTNQAQSNLSEILNSVHLLITSFADDLSHLDKERELFTSVYRVPVHFILLSKFDAVIGSEGYYLNICRDSVTLSANDKAGVYRGISTFYQILFSNASGHIPCCEITDYPTYSYRAMHLDVCRHFFSEEFIKKYIDQLAYYKINTLHWHLTDDQGWRIEIKKYPKLTEVGAWRTEKDGSRYGGYYTQEDIKEIVAYAQERYITIIPEIEMPGHSSAALAAYPYLGCTGEQITVPNTWGIKKDIYAPTDTVFRFFEDVMDEVCGLFPGRYIHIGGDEAPKAQWKNSPIAQAVMKQNNLKDEEELQHYFMHRVEKYLNAKGKIAIGWGEVVKGGLSDSIVVMSWLSKGAGIKAAKHGNNVIMAPRGYCYFDYPQEGDHIKAIWMLPLHMKKVYKFNPLPSNLSTTAQKHILGGEATLWTEYVQTEKQAEHQLMPRLAALAEALWTAPARKDFEDFKRRLRESGAIIK